MDWLFLLLLLLSLLVVWVLVPRWVPAVGLHIEKPRAVGLLAVSLVLVSYMLRFAYRFELRRVLHQELEKTPFDVALKWGTVGSVLTVLVFLGAAYVAEVFYAEEQKNLLLMALVSGALVSGTALL